jgi:hypothetical protein
MSQFVLSLINNKNKIKDEKMNKLSEYRIIQIPEVIIEYIISFTCDRRGYNIDHYNERKKDNWIRMMRINKEIQYFNMISCSVPWLSGTSKQRKQIKDFKVSLKDGKPKVTYHTGCYKSLNDEFRSNCRLDE